jgi:hypothetical protein
LTVKRAAAACSIPETRSQTLDLGDHFLEILHHMTVESGRGLRIFFEDPPEQPAVDLQKFQAGHRGGAGEVGGFGDQREFAEEASRFRPSDADAAGFPFVEEINRTADDDEGAIGGLSFPEEVFAGGDTHIFRAEGEEPYLILRETPEETHAGQGAYVIVQRQSLSP